MDSFPESDWVWAKPTLEKKIHRRSGMRYVALLRGVNVGGNCIIKMADLKTAFERRGFQNVRTYINSGNVIFDTDITDEAALKAACEKLMAEDFSMDNPICVISAADFAEALAHAPAFWNTAPDTKHNAIFIIPPMTAEEIIARVGTVREEFEKVAYHGKVVFWSAPAATFSRTRWSKISADKTLYRAITVRNANTAVKLAELMKG
jgi:uncharacterized protein (DUF1697 family)